MRDNHSLLHIEIPLAGMQVLLYGVRHLKEGLRGHLKRLGRGNGGLRCRRYRGCQHSGHHTRSGRHGWLLGERALVLQMDMVAHQSVTNILLWASSLLLVVCKAAARPIHTLDTVPTQLGLEQEVRLLKILQVMIVAIVSIRTVPVDVVNANAVLDANFLPFRTCGTGWRPIHLRRFSDGGEIDEILVIGDYVCAVLAQNQFRNAFGIHSEHFFAILFLRDFDLRSLEKRA